MNTILLFLKYNHHHHHHHAILVTETKIFAITYSQELVDLLVTNTVKIFYLRTHLIEAGEIRKFKCADLRMILRNIKFNFRSIA